MTDTELIESTKIRMIAAECALRNLTGSAASVMPIPGTERVIATGTKAEIAKLLGGAAPTVAGLESLTEQVRASLRRAYNLGQTYWQQADSEYISQHRKADVTAGCFVELIDATVADVERWAASHAGAVAAPDDREKLLRTALDAAAKWADAEHLHARDIGRGGRGMLNKSERAEKVARTAIEALATPSTAAVRADEDVERDLGLPELADEFFAFGNLGGRFTLSWRECLRLYEAMTNTPAADSGNRSEG